MEELNKKPKRNEVLATEEKEEKQIFFRTCGMASAECKPETKN